QWFFPPDIPSDFSQWFFPPDIPSGFSPMSVKVETFKILNSSSGMSGDNRQVRPLAALDDVSKLVVLVTISLLSARETGTRLIALLTLHSSRLDSLGSCCEWDPVSLTSVSIDNVFPDNFPSDLNSEILQE